MLSKLLVLAVFCVGCGGASGTSDGATSSDAAQASGDAATSTVDSGGSDDLGAASTDAASNRGDAGHAGDAAMPTGGVARPSYNKGVGFFVLNGKLYDANGIEFRVRGVDKLHWDFQSPGLANSKANTVRWNIDFTQPVANNLALLQGGAGKNSGTIYDKMVVMPGAWTTPAGATTCSNDPNIIASAVSVWVDQAATWKQIEKYSILNIANEWGPANSTVWRDTYISAIAKMRAAGLHATLSITSGQCGQDNADLVNYAQAVFDSDPEKNVIFDRHVYGGDANVTQLMQDAAALAGLKLPIIFGEFGPGQNIGPSPTELSPADVIATAEQYDFGWMAWAWDDSGGMANTWFALSYNENYSSSADLTIYGQVVLEGCTNAAPGGCGCPDKPEPALTAVAPGCKGTPAPTYSKDSLKALAVPATIF